MVSNIGSEKVRSTGTSIYHDCKYNCANYHLCKRWASKFPSNFCLERDNRRPRSLIKEIRNKDKGETRETRDYRQVCVQPAFNIYFFFLSFMEIHYLAWPLCPLAFNLKYASTFPNVVTLYCL